MSKPTVKPNSEPRSSENEQPVRTHLNDIANIIAAYTSGREFAPFRIQAKALDASDNLITIMDEEIIDQKVDFLQTALENPHLVEGTLIISSGGETILHIERGKVVQDTIGLTLKYPFENQLHQQKSTLGFDQDFDKAFREITGKNLVKYGLGILAFFGQRQKDGSVKYETANYLYTEREGQLKIIAKQDNREVLNNNGFTEAAAKEDIAILVKLKEGIEKLKLDNPPPLIPGVKL